VLLAGPIILGAAILIGIVATSPAEARDDGRYADNPLHSWFEGLSSGKGLCCDFTDGQRVDDVEWGSEDGHYWVIVDGKKIIVPDDAIVNVPNKAGPAFVWPYLSDGVTKVRCFLRGTEG
jgi:hypothetical protein